MELNDNGLTPILVDIPKVVKCYLCVTGIETSDTCLKIHYVRRMDVSNIHVSSKTENSRIELNPISSLTHTDGMKSCMIIPHVVPSMLSNIHCDSTVYKLMVKDL